MYHYLFDIYLLITVGNHKKQDSAVIFMFCSITFLFLLERGRK